jgi:Zn finger protein HypA/HybF involved in hydrogenase expression
MPNNEITLDGDKSLRKSEMVELSRLEAELTDIWGFNPWKVLTRTPVLNRFTNLAEWECKNCNHKFSSTIHGLEAMREKSGCYCPSCRASHNPVWQFKLLSDYSEVDEKYKTIIKSEYAIMTEIQDHYKCDPYNFISYTDGSRFKLEHKCCSTIFSATFSLMYNNDTIMDPYTGKPLTLPFCPRCNEIMKNENKNYGGIRMIEKLSTYFEHGKTEMPYEFAENYLLQFKGYDYPMIVTCKYCKNDFSATPNKLFSSSYRSQCPYCDGKSKPLDSAENSIKNLEIEKNVIDSTKEEEAKMPQQVEITDDATSGPLLNTDDFDGLFGVGENQPDEREEVLENQDEIEPEVDPDIDINNQIDAAGYPDEYIPSEDTAIPIPEFANPNIADEEANNEYDDEVIDEAIDDINNFKPETVDEFEESVKEITDDFNSLNDSQQSVNEIFTQESGLLGVDGPDMGRCIGGFADEPVNNQFDISVLVSSNDTDEIGQNENQVDIINSDSRPDVNKINTILGERRENIRDEQDDMIDADIFSSMG